MIMSLHLAATLSVLASLASAQPPLCQLPACIDPCTEYDAGLIECEEGALTCTSNVDCNGCWATYTTADGQTSTCTPKSVSPSTTMCQPPPCVNPCSEYEQGLIACPNYPKAVCVSRSDCSSCWAEYTNGIDGEIINCDATTTTSTPETTPCVLPPCVDPCSAFNNADLFGSEPYCEGHPNTICQGYAECNKGCYAKYFDAETGEEITDCVLTYAPLTTTTETKTTYTTTTKSADTTASGTDPATTKVTDATTTKLTESTDAATTKGTETTTGCLIDCADPCALNECAAYPDAICDFTVDCEKGCIPFWTDADGTVLDCDQDDSSCLVKDETAWDVVSGTCKFCLCTEVGQQVCEAVINGLGDDLVDKFVEQCPDLDCVFGVEAVDGVSECSCHAFQCTTLSNESNRHGIRMLTLIGLTVVFWASM